MAFIDPRAGAIDVERRFETPVELEQKTVVSRETEYKIPFLQALALGVGVALTLGAFLWLLAAWGERAFYIGTLISGIANLIWILRRADEFEDGINLSDIVAAIMVALFTGALFFCLWGIVSYLAPAAHFARWQAVVSLLVFVAVGATTFFLIPAFIQELLQRSPFQEQAIWGAVFTWLKKPEDILSAPPQEVIHRTQIELTRRRPGSGLRQDIFDLPARITPEQMEQVARRWLGGWAFSEMCMAGKERPLSGGRGGQYEQLRDVLIDKGLAKWVDENAHTLGVEITDEGKQVFEEYADGDNDD